MNCDHVKRNIYLYDELSDMEKRAVDDHIAQCDECTLLFRHMQQHRAIVEKAATWRESPADSANLTQKIMSSVRKDSRRRVISIDTIPDLFYLRPVRFALTSLSLFLIVLFISEHKTTWSYSQNNKAEYNSSNREGSIVLNSGSFVKELRLKKKQSSLISVYKCLRLCHIDNNTHLCDECETRLKKLARVYESFHEPY